MAPIPLPMPTPTVPPKPLLSYKLLSFDIYGTLIDWESSIISHLQPLVDRLPPDHTYKKAATDGTPGGRLALAARFNEIEAGIQSANPGMIYSELLRQAYLDLAKELEFDTTDAAIQTEAKEFGDSIGTWAAFPDTLDAMNRLSKHYKLLIPLSNVDTGSFEGTLSGPLKSFPFTTYYLASMIGSYKPSLQNFHYLLDHVKQDYQVDKQDVLHVAQSLFHDHVPAKEMGMSSVWIARQGAGMGLGGNPEQVHSAGKVGYAWRFSTLGEFADKVEEEAAKQ